MIEAPIPANEAERLADLSALAILDTPPEGRFDDLVRLAARVFNVPMAYIAMVDCDRQWFKARHGVDIRQTDRRISFCGHTILGKTALIVPDASRDERFHDNPLVVGEPHIRFYAGFPLAGPGGHNVGTFCVASPEPRSPAPDEIAALKTLAAIAERELNMIELIRAQREIIETKNTLLKTQERLSRELAEAAEYVRSLLPPRLERPVRTDWEFIASSDLGGDLFGYRWLDNARLAVYLFDVSGHGVGASLMSIAVHNAIHRGTLPDVRFDDPGDVLAALNRTFPMAENNNKFLTIWYGVYEPAKRSLRYSSAGHPPAIAVAGSMPPARLGSPNILIGLDPEARFETNAATLLPGSRVYLFSDGVYEVQGSDGRLLDLDGLIELLATEARDGPSRVQSIRRRIQGFHGSDEFADDFSLLEIEV